MAKTPTMKQEVRIKLDVSLTISAEHSTEELTAIIERGARTAFPNHHKRFHEIRFAEERELYGLRRYPRWTPIIRKPA